MVSAAPGTSDSRVPRIRRARFRPFQHGACKSRFPAVSWWMGLPVSGLEPPEWRPNGAQRATARPQRNVVPLRNREYSPGILYLRFAGHAPPTALVRTDARPSCACSRSAACWRQHVLNNWPLVARRRCGRCISPPKPLGRRLYVNFLNLAIPSALPGSALACKAQKEVASPSPSLTRRRWYAEKRGVP